MELNWMNNKYSIGWRIGVKMRNKIGKK